MSRDAACKEDAQTLLLPPQKFFPPVEWQDMGLGNLTISRRPEEVLIVEEPL